MSACRPLQHLSSLRQAAPSLSSIRASLLNVCSLSQTQHYKHWAFFAMCSMTLSGFLNKQRWISWRYSQQQNRSDGTGHICLRLRESLLKTLQSPQWDARCSCSPKAPGSEYFLLRTDHANSKNEGSGSDSILQCRSWQVHHDGIYGMSSRIKSLFTTAAADSKPETCQWPVIGGPCKCLTALGG